MIGIRPESRAQAADAELVAAVDRSSAIFMTGGNQVKLATLVVGTPLGKAIVAAHRRGALVAGTSAGASICSTHMVSFGSGGSTPKFRIGQVSEGLGLLDGMIIDQHFTQRNRFGRLLALVAGNPAQLGVGIDEDTAAIVRSDGLLEVKGRGVVTIVDGADVVTTAYTATGTQPLMMSGIRLHSRGRRARGHQAATPPDRGRRRPRDDLGAAPSTGVILSGLSRRDLPGRTGRPGQGPVPFVRAAAAAVIGRRWRGRPQDSRETVAKRANQRKPGRPRGPSNRGRRGRSSPRRGAGRARERIAGRSTCFIGKAHS